MIELTRGDKESLEGRVVIYGRVIGNQGSTDLTSRAPEATILALYAATNRTDFVSSPFLNGLSPKSLRDLERITADMERISEAFPMDASAKPIKVYSTFLQKVQSKEELFAGSEDIVFVGEYHNASICRMALSKVLELYIFRFGDQAITKSGMSPSKKGAAKSHPVTYKDIQGKDMLNHISTNYVRQMLDAQKRGDKEEFLRLKRELVLFGLTAPFSSDLFALCAEMENNGKTPNLPLIEAYVGKISAIHLEDYIAASVLHSKINELKRKA